MKPLTRGDALGVLRVASCFDEQVERILQAAGGHDRAAVIHLLVELAHACHGVANLLEAEGAGDEPDA